MAKLRAQQNLIKNWISIVLTVLSLIQGFAFNYLADKLPNIYEELGKSYVVGAHFVLCFVILVRVYQTFMAAVLDYDFILPGSFEILLITTIGVAEFFLFSSLKDGSIQNFSPDSFHGRGILLACMAAIGYFITLWQIVVRRDEGTGRNVIPFKIVRRRIREGRARKVDKDQMIPSMRTLFKYKTPKTYCREVLLQEVNIISLLVIIAIEVLVVLSKPGRRKLIGLVIVIMAILCSNVFYSTRVTFGRREKLSKPQLS